MVTTGNTKAIAYVRPIVMRPYLLTRKSRTRANGICARLTKSRHPDGQPTKSVRIPAGTGLARESSMPCAMAPAAPPWEFFPHGVNYSPESAGRARRIC